MFGLGGGDPLTRDDGDTVQQEHFKAVVIGAGAGGLVALKELVAAGVGPVVCLDKGEGVGGLFRGSYHGLFLTSSAAFSMFSDFPPPDGRHSAFWTKAEVTEYWQGYANRFGLMPLIRFGVTVGSTTQTADGWTVDCGDRVITCDHLVVATGNNVFPVSPDWVAQATEVEVMHSADYRDAARFAGKSVVIVGGGESASDITLEVAKVAARTHVSLRNGPGWVVPRLRGDLAADISTHRGFWTLPFQWGRRISPKLVEADRRRGETSPVLAEVARLNAKVASPYGIRGIFGTKSLGLPTAIAEHGAKVIGEVAKVLDGGRTLLTQDGERIEGVDAILLATGYGSRVPFLPEGLRRIDPRKMYKNIFLPEFEAALAFIGFARPTFGSQFPVMELQARFAAQVLSGARTLPPPVNMAETAASDSAALTEQFGPTGDRVRGLVDYPSYMEGMARLIGCRPRLWRLALTDPRLWLHVVYGPMQATQYRLHGPGAKPAEARAILMALPVSPFNHIVKAGLRSRLIDVLTLGPIRRRLGLGR